MAHAVQFTGKCGSWTAHDSKCDKNNQKASKVQASRHLDARFAKGVPRSRTRRWWRISLVSVVVATRGVVFGSQSMQMRQASEQRQSTGDLFLSLLHGSAVFTLQVTGSRVFYCLGRQSATASDTTLEQSALGQSIFVPAVQSASVHTRYQSCVESLEWHVAIWV